MKTINLSNMDIKIYYEKLKNGLEIYLIPKDNVSDTYALFTTKYGSVNSEFVPIGEDEMVKVPDGIAHFLEHKLFESEDGVHPFTFYNEQGADVNAFTNYFNTSYLFSGTENIEDCMNYLLDYVQKPYFTEENVEKEKGIIEQELLMYKDIPIDQMYDLTFANAFEKHPVRIPIGGTPSSIKKITKDDLYTCYNTFYHPTNMFVTVSGNFDYKKMLKLITDNQAKKEFCPPFEIQNQTYDEPDEVTKQKETVKMNVSIPKVTISFKINLEKFKKLSNRLIAMYIMLYFDSKLGSTSILLEKLKKEKIVTTGINIDHLRTDKHVLVIVNTDTLAKDEFTSAIHKTLKEKTITEEEFERKRKILISRNIFDSDSPHRINSRLLNTLITDNKVIDYDTEIRNLTFKDYQNVVKNLDLSNYTELIIEPLK